MLAMPLRYHGLQLFRPPYESCDPINADTHPGTLAPGQAAVWFMTPSARLEDELRWAAVRPRGLPLFVVLPTPEQVYELSNVVRLVPGLRPKGVLPGGGAGTLAALRTLMAAPPVALPKTATDYLEEMGVIIHPIMRERVEAVFSAAPNTRSIEALARKLCQSRRTLGRLFRDHGLPVPSHWLQFGRVLHVAIQLQNTSLSIGRVATRFGYPDGFTMSNTMKRLTGFRPSFVRDHLGWEWILEAWWQEESKD